MILLVFVARVADSLLLVASTDQMRSSDSQDTMDVYKSQARQILRKLDARSPARCSIESGPYTLHYVISECCCYLAMTHRSYPKRLIFQYLEEIARDFAEEVARDCGGDWRSAVETVGRPYAFITAFIKFDKTLQRKRKAYANPGDRANQSKIDSEIADIHNIMKRNIDEVLNRGERLDHLVESTSTLKHEAAKCKWGAKKFHAMAVWQQYAPFVAVGACCLFVAWLKLR
ncbi:hypothetical protein JL721_1542 [Aureococcus anophagefferens]|nr:hypothetical protein JL721_1542 [Aureococcus anophagefferens]